MSHVDRFAATSRRRWWLLLLALAVVLVAGWSGLWFYAASRVQAEMAAWRQREAEAGRVQECASETVGGAAGGSDIAQRLRGLSAEVRRLLPPTKRGEPVA